MANTEFTADPVNSISDGDLPWAMVLLPTTSAGHSGIGMNKHGLLPESWVYGIFMDGKNAQQPLIIGTIAGGPGQGRTPQPPARRL